MANASTRTSDRKALNQAFVFYTAIRERRYFSEIPRSQNAALKVKMLRYYARFLMLCMLRNQKDMARLLLKEFGGFVEEYIRGKTSDGEAWQAVLVEITNFMDAESSFIPNGIEEINLDNLLLIDTKGRLRLQQAVLVGNCKDQQKFSDLTLDVFRMHTLIERITESLDTKTGSEEIKTKITLPTKSPKDYHQVQIRQSSKVLPAGIYSSSTQQEQ